MKKTVFIGLFILSVMFGFAHAPRTVNLEYDKSKETLQIEVVHQVRNVERHYVEEITISVNGEKKHLADFEKQSDPDKEVYSYKIGKLSSGDVVEVNASCSRLGSRSAELKMK